MKRFLTMLFVITFFVRSSGQQSFNLFSFPGSDKDQTLFFLNDNDGGISGINSIPVFQCTSLITPTIQIENYGTNVLTSATITYFLDGGSAQYYFWEGALEPYFTDDVTLPAMAVTEGNHLLNVLVTEANGELDFNNSNNESIEFNIVGDGLPVPFEESFSGEQLPEGFFIINMNHEVTWELFENPVVSGSHHRCIRMPFYFNDVDEDVDELYSQSIDLLNAITPQLSFDVAYCYYNNDYWDQLQVWVSTDCGNLWDVIYDKSKDELETALSSDIPFIPKAFQWRTEYLDLSAYSGQSDVLIKFVAVSGHGNNLYLDNVNVSEITGIESAEENVFDIFPIPASDYVKVSLRQNFSGSVLISNCLGQIVFSNLASNQNQIFIPVNNVSAGSYFISLIDEKGNIDSKKIIIKRD